MHGIAAVSGLGSLCGGVYLLAGAGASLAVLGGILLAAVVYARTRGTTDARTTD